MSSMQQLAEGLQKIDERREKMDAVIHLVQAFFEQAGNIPSELPNGNTVTLRILDEPYEDGGSDQFLTIRGDVKQADPQNEDYRFGFDITVTGSGSVEVISQNDFGKNQTFSFDMDRYSVADAFAKIVLEIEDNDYENLGPHLLHAQKVIKQDMGMALANGPKPAL